MGLERMFTFQDVPFRCIAPDLFIFGIPAFVTKDFWTIKNFCEEFIELRVQDNRH